MSHDDNNGMTIAQEEQAKHVLDKENFDLKMQVQNLAEQLRKSSSWEGGGGGGDSSLKLELQERQLELNERNMLLSKAKTAITEMRKELERVRRENDPAIKAELEARVAKLKASNEQLDLECRRTVSAMEVELVKTNERLHLQDEDKARTETRLEQAELSLSHAEQRLAEVREEKNKQEESWLLLQQKAERMEEEVTQARAHVELYRMETQEAIEERDSLREHLAQARDSTHVADQLNSQREEMEQKHEEAMNKINQLHTQAMEHNHLEMEKLAEDRKLILIQEKNLHEKHVQELAQRHESEVARLREEAMKTKDEMRMDRQREREEAAARMDEKTTEIKHLHSQLETQRNKADHQLKEAETARVDLESCKVELGFRADQADQYKNESQELHAEVKLLKRSHEQAAELREGLRREQADKASLEVRYLEEKETLQHKLDQVTDTLDNLKHSYHEKESRTKLAESELSTIKASHSTVETISRDNEKFKSEVTRLNQELLQTTHEASNLKRDVEHATNVLAERNKTIEMQASEITHMERANATLTASKDELNEILRADREKHVGMEALLAELHSTTQASIAEHKDVAATFKAELDDMELKYLAAEKARMHLESKHETMRHDYINELQGSIEHLETWDGTLTDLVDGIEGYAVGSERHHQEQLVLQESTQSITRALGQKGFLTKGTHTNIRDGDVGDHLLPAISALSERIKIKMKRATKLRVHLAQQMAKQVTIVTEKLESTHQRNQLLAHRIDASDAALKRISTVLTRDRKAAEHEQTEGKLFREQTMKHLNDNARTLKEVEDRRVTEITAHLSQISDLQKDVLARERAAELAAQDLQHKENTIADLRAEVDAYGQAEQVVQELSDRLQDVVAAKEDLSREMQHLEEVLDAAQREVAELTEERSNALERCEHFEKRTEDLQHQLDNAAGNIESLRASQITPELAQMIRDTQNIIRSTKSDHESVQKLENSYLSSHPAAQQLLGMASQPQSQTQETGRSSAAASPGSGSAWSPPKGSASSMQSPVPVSPTSQRTPLGSMLDSRALGGRDRDRAAGESTTGSRSSSSSSSHAHESSRQGGSSSSSSRGGSSTSYAQRSKPESNSNSNSNSNSSSSSSRKSVFTARGASPGGGATYAQYSPVPALSTQAQTFLRSTPNFSTGTPQRAAYSRDRESADMGSSPAPSLRTPSSQKQQQQQQLSSQRQSAAATPAAGLTPNTQTRQSVHRLNKLGSDIEALARKLDGFDSADRNRWNK